MPNTFTERERRLLDLIQTDYPLCEAPYAALGSAVGCMADEAFAGVMGLYTRRVIRRIGGSFDARRFGYTSLLAGARVAPEQLAEVAARVNAFSEVTHNYSRNHAVNLWFTIIARDAARREALLAEVRALPGVGELLALPALRIFKLQVDFRFGDAPAPLCAPRDEMTLPPWDAVDAALIPRACGDLPPVPRPYAALAEELAIPESVLLNRLARYRAARVLRRFGAIVRHQLAGYTSNAMVVWNVPEAEVEQAGRRLAACAAITHCYQRPAVPGWPYTLYTMLHAHTPAACAATLATLAGREGLSDYLPLNSVREWKKSSMVYQVEVK